ncbi:MAG: diguanylate cyclase, partial [Pseudomonadota bacterium]
PKTSSPFLNVFEMVNGWEPRTCAEFIILPEQEIYHKPPSLSFEDATGIPLAGQTALQAIRDLGKLKAGQKILINGASGGVGTLAIQIAKALGGQVTTVSRAIITLSYGFSLSYHGAPPELIRFETSVLMVVSVVALVFAYTLEHSQRLSFLQRRIMQVLSSVDSLTGLKNRRVFDEELESLWKQGHRDSNPLGLLLVDVDHFKAFNDRYGHQAGDRCLARIGEVLGDSVRRPLDIAARVGGEEFALLFYAATPEHVVAAGKQIEEEIRALEIPHADSSTAPVVTVSIGAGLIQPRPNRSPESLVKQVDLALYQAKSQGRGRLTWFESDHQLGDEVVAAVRSS